MNKHVSETPFHAMSGWPMLCVCIGLIAAAVPTFISAVASESVPLVILALMFLISGIITIVGFQAVAPNQARVLLLFGDYRGTLRESGFFWVNPFFSKKKISLRIRNFETGSISTPEQTDSAGKILQAKSRTAGRPSKVNDRDGNPIDISAVVVWRVVNTAESLFEVDDYEHFVAVQSEAALRNLASRHPYDSEDHEMSLRGNTTEVCDQLQVRHPGTTGEGGGGGDRGEDQSPGIRGGNRGGDASTSASPGGRCPRTRKSWKVRWEWWRWHWTTCRKENCGTGMTSGGRRWYRTLLVVLCSDRHTQPVVNTGTLYH